MSLRYLPTPQAAPPPLEDDAPAQTWEPDPPRPPARMPEALRKAYLAQKARQIPKGLQGQPDVGQLALDALKEGFKQNLTGSILDGADRELAARGAPVAKPTLQQLYEQAAARRIPDHPEAAPAPLTTMDALRSVLGDAADLGTDLLHAPAAALGEVATQGRGIASADLPGLEAHDEGLLREFEDRARRAHETTAGAAGFAGYSAGMLADPALLMAGPEALLPKAATEGLGLTGRLGLLRAQGTAGAYMGGTTATRGGSPGEVADAVAQGILLGTAGGAGHAVRSSGRELPGLASTPDLPPTVERGTFEERYPEGAPLAVSGVPDVGGVSPEAPAVPDRKAQRGDPTQQTQAQWVASRPKLARGDSPRTVGDLTNNLQLGDRAGVSYHQPNAYHHVFVEQDVDGNPIGALRIYQDPTGHYPPLLEVAVDPNFQRQGVATELYEAAAKHGFDVEDMSGNEAQTPEGAAFQHARAVKRALAEGRPISPEALDAYPDLVDHQGEGILNAQAAGAVSLYRDPPAGARRGSIGGGKSNRFSDEENAAYGQDAMNRILDDPDLPGVWRAMHRSDVGIIAFLRGHGGYGIHKILTKHLDGHDPRELLHKLVDVIAKGEDATRPNERAEGKRALEHDGYRVVLQRRPRSEGEKSAYVLTGYKKTAPGESGEFHSQEPTSGASRESRATASDLRTSDLRGSRSDMGAGADPTLSQDEPPSNPEGPRRYHPRQGSISNTSHDLGEAFAKLFGRAGVTMDPADLLRESKVKKKIASLQLAEKEALRAGMASEAAEYRQRWQALRDAKILVGDRPSYQSNPANARPGRFTNRRKLNLSTEGNAKLDDLERQWIAENGLDPKPRFTQQQIRDEAAAKWGPEVLDNQEKLKPGETMHPAEYYATQEYLGSITHEIVRQEEHLAQNRGTMTPEEVQAAEASIMVLERDSKALLDRLGLARSQNGRNLAFLKMVNQGSFDASYWIGRANRLSGGHASAGVVRQLRRILREGTAAQTAGDAAGVRAARIELAKTMAKLDKDGLLKTASYVRKAAMLSSMRTLEKVTLSHFLQQLAEGVSKVPAAAVDAAVSRVAGTERTVYVPGPLRVLTAQRKMLVDGIREGWQILRHGLPEEDLAKLQIPRELNSNIPLLRHLLNPAVNLIFRMHSAVYHPFQIYAIERSLQDQAMQIARHEAQARPGLDVRARAAAIRANPETALGKQRAAVMAAEALSDGQFATFSEHNNVSTAISAFKRATPEPIRTLGVDFNIPFSHVPLNIVSRVLEYSWVGGAYKAARLAHARYVGEVTGALTREEQKTIAMALGRGLTGSALMALGAMLYSKQSPLVNRLFAAAGIDGITGTQDQKTRRLDAATGHQADALRVNGHYVKTDALSPVGNLLVMGATLARDGFNPVALLTVGIKTILEQPMTAGLEILDQVKEDPVKGLGAFAGSVAGSYVPAALADVAAAGDTVQRQLSHELPGSLADLAHTGNAITDAVANRVPGLREHLMPKLDVYGKEVPNERQGAAGYNTLTGKPDRTVENGLLRELDRLKLNPPGDRKDIEMGRKLKLELDPRQAHALAREVGKARALIAPKVIASKAYQEASDQEQREILGSVMATARKIGTAQFVKANRPTVAAKLLNAAKARKEALAPRGAGGPTAAAAGSMRDQNIQKTADEPL